MTKQSPAGLGKRWEVALPKARTRYTPGLHCSAVSLAAQAEKGFWDSYGFSAPKTKRRHIMT